MRKRRKRKNKRKMRNRRKRRKMRKIRKSALLRCYLNGKAPITCQGLVGFLKWIDESM